MADMSPVLTEKVIVYYPGRRCSGIAGSTVPLWYNREYNLVDINFSDPDFGNFFSGVGGAFLIIHDTCQALMSPGVTDPTNKVKLEDLTQQIAQDFYDFRSFSCDMAFIGPCALVPIALYDYIEFSYDADEPDEEDYDRIEAIEERLRPNCMTRVFTEPWNGEVQEMQHMDPDISQCTDQNNSNDPVEFVPCITYYEGHGECVGGGATGTATISGGAITAVTVTGGGSYSTTPSVIVSGDGTGAVLTAVLTGNAVSSVTVNNGGMNYQTAIISFKGGGTKLQLIRRLLCLEDGRLVSKFISYDTVGP